MSARSLSSLFDPSLPFQPFVPTTSWADPVERKHLNERELTAYVQSVRDRGISVLESILQNYNPSELEWGDSSVGPAESPSKRAKTPQEIKLDARAVKKSLKQSALEEEKMRKKQVKAFKKATRAAGKKTHLK